MLVKKEQKLKLSPNINAVSQQLEAKADQSFNVIYQQLQYDLEKNGHSLNEAQEYPANIQFKKRKQSQSNCQ